MASKSGMFLQDEDREKLIQKLEEQGEITPSKTSGRRTRSSSRSNSPKGNGHHHHAYEMPFGTGCLTCGQDDDHANLMLCEGCNDEYHTYCLDPPLRAVPTGDWFCSKFGVMS